MTGNLEAIVQRLKTIEAHVGLKGAQLDKTDLAVGNVELRMSDAEPTTSAIKGQAETLEPQAKRSKSSCQFDVDDSSESVPSSITMGNVVTPAESENSDESDIAMSPNEDKDKAKPLDNGSLPSLPTEHGRTLSSSDENSKDLKISTGPLGSIHPAVRKRHRTAYEKDKLYANAAIRMYNLTYQSLNPNAVLKELRFIGYISSVSYPQTAKQMRRLYDDDVKEILECLDVEIPKDAESRKALLADLIGVKLELKG